MGIAMDHRYATETSRSKALEKAACSGCKESLEKSVTKQPYLLFWAVRCLQRLVGKWRQFQSVYAVAKASAGQGTFPVPLLRAPVQLAAWFASFLRVR